MKLQHLGIGAVALCLSTIATAQSGSATPVYINQNFGFNVEGYNYTQSEFPCDIDKVLVDEIIARGSKNQLDIEAVSTADKIRNGEIPVIAIDIEALVLGSEEYTFGTKSHSNLPSVRVTAALIQGNSPEGLTTAKHSCAIAHLNELTPTSSVLDLGTTHTVCSATHKCLKDLSKDIVQWVAPQLR